MGTSPSLCSEEVNERAEFHHLYHGAIIEMADFPDRSDRLDPLDRRPDLITVGGRRPSRYRRSSMFTLLAPVFSTISRITYCRRADPLRSMSVSS